MSQKKPRNLPSLSLQVKQIVARRSLKDGQAVVLYVERAIGGSGQT
jgi:hypothetical protein